MNNIMIAFITGITTGGLSCLAVQGGLLASTLASQVELDLQQQPLLKNKKGKIATQPGLAKRVHLARPILLFLVAKLVMYTLLGFLLGALGSVLQLNAITRGILQAAIGIFMLGTALRMFNVHPIFRYFSFEPPAFVRRYIRRVSKNGDSAITPLFLGALTVLIPCGVTQAMMAIAIGTADPFSGAAILFAFILGTSPLFFIVAYLTTRLGTTMEKYFMRFVAVVVLILGLISLDAGLTLMGAPFSPSNLIIRLSAPVQADQTATQPAEASSAPATAGQSQGVTELAVSAQNNGYQPNFLTAPANKPVHLTLTTMNTRSCSRAFEIPEMGVQKILPVTGSVSIDIPSQQPGKILYFSCSMGMYTGAIQFN